MKRIDKNNYYLDIAEVTLERATCLRKKWGAVIVKLHERKIKYSKRRKIRIM